jgi:hypothetical protein
LEDVAAELVGLTGDGMVLEDFVELVVRRVRAGSDVDALLALVAAHGAPDATVAMTEHRLKLVKVSGICEAWRR